MTKFYLHSALTNVSGSLPINQVGGTAPTLQGGLSPFQYKADSSSVNRSMDPFKGTSQTSIAWNTLATAASETYYVTKWVSQPLLTTSISANTWTLIYAAAESTFSNNFVGPSVYVYVWRPSNGTRVGWLINGVAPVGFAEPSAINTEKLQNMTITGSAVTAQVGDVIIFEFWARITQASATSLTDTIYFDGTTENTSATNTTVSDLAAYLSTPQTLNFYYSYSLSESVGSISEALSRDAIKKIAENIGSVTEHVKAVDTKTAMTTSLSASSVTTKTRIVPRTLSEPSLSISATVTKKLTTRITTSLSVSEKITIKATRTISQALGSVTEHVTKIPIRNILTSLSASSATTKRALLKALTVSYPVSEHVSNFNVKSVLTTSLAIGMSLTSNAIRHISETVGISDLIDISVITSHFKTIHIIEPPVPISEKITAKNTRTAQQESSPVSEVVTKRSMSQITENLGSITDLVSRTAASNILELLSVSFSVTKKLATRITTSLATSELVHGARQRSYTISESVTIGADNIAKSLTTTIREPSLAISEIITKHPITQPVQRVRRVIGDVAGLFTFGN